MTAKKPSTKDIKLTTAQVDKLNLYSAQQDAAKRRLDEYLSAVLDAAGVEGTWDVLGMDKQVLKLEKNG